MDFNTSAWKVVLVAGFCAAGIYFAIPTGGDQDVLYAAFGAASVICILVGIRIRRPVNPLGWYLLALAGVCFTLGDDVLSFYYPLIHVVPPFPSIADALYLAGYPFLFAGILRLTGNPNFRIRREDNADAAIVGLGALALSWQFLMSSYVQDASIGTFGKLVNLAYPIMDVALIFILFQALLSGRARQPFHKLLAIAMIVMFLGDFFYDILVLHNSYVSGGPSDAFFLVEYVVVAAAAVHPSVAIAPVQAADNYESRSTRRTQARARLPIIIVAGFVAPTILLVSTAIGQTVSVIALTFLSLAVFVAICLRMSWMILRLDTQAAEVEEARAHLLYMAMHDELTGVANRAEMYKELGEALASLDLATGPVALCVGDLDRFKSINDTLGHHIGDRVLVKASQLLQSIVREGDTLARLGGDEFAVLMVGIDSESTAIEFARQMVASFRDGVEIDGHQANVTMSVGVASASSNRPIEQVLSEADAALHSAKTRGKGRAEVFKKSMRARLLERSELTDGLGGALERSEFFLEYQPVFSLDDGHLLGFEALVRWMHPLRGRVTPDQFIPIAEETGFIVSLGRWVFLEACERLARWDAFAGHGSTIAVNLSRRQLTAPDLISDVKAALAVSGVSPERLVLEVTESVLMERPEQAIAILGQLRDMGIRMAIDDFGTGYSSLSLLQQIPVDILKIDKAFVDPLNQNEPASSSIVRSVVELAHSLGLLVVAEGIERQDQKDRLGQLGCDAGQGFLLGRPLGEVQATELASLQFEARDSSSIA